MRYVMLFCTSLLLFLYSSHHVKKSLTRDGEYHASLYFLGSTTTNISIVTNMYNSSFITHSYLKSPALDEAAVFVSKGVFLDDDADGNYSLSYSMKETHPPRVLEPQKSKFYLDMVARIGHPIDEKISLIYHNR
ncbi:hypothetical protein, partial [Aeromonas sp. HMWF016]|uniref:hypothetical protein n=1 Tax=Aeromonas sp. HMWF016 TaxID=2056852 RepID=UPI0011B1DC5E